MPSSRASQRHHRLGDGIQRRQPAAPGRARRRAVPDHAGALRLLGHRIRLQAAAARRARRSRRAAAASPRAAPSRCWPTAPTKTPPTASTPRRSSSTWAPTRWPLPPSGWTSHATCCAPGRACCRPTPTTRCCAARCPTRCRRGRAVGVLVRQIGGVRTLRDHPGSGRDPLQPVDAAVQRRALDLLASHVLAADACRLSRPALQRRLAPDFDDRRAVRRRSGAGTDFSRCRSGCWSCSARCWPS
jgi:hypothetical protein